MSRKNVLPAYKIINAGDMSQATVTSSVTNILYLDNIAIQLNIGAGATGTFAVQGSLDYAQDTFGNVTNAGNWITVTPSPVITQPTGSASNQLLAINQAGFPWIRVLYTKTSGTGTLNAYISGKTI